MPITELECGSSPLKEFVASRLRERNMRHGGDIFEEKRLTSYFVRFGYHVFHWTVFDPNDVLYLKYVTQDLCSGTSHVVTVTVDYIIGGAVVSDVYSPDQATFEAAVATAQSLVDHSAVIIDTATSYKLEYYDIGGAVLITSMQDLSQPKTLEQAAATVLALLAVGNFDLINYGQQMGIWYDVEGGTGSIIRDIQPYDLGTQSLDPIIAGAAQVGGTWSSSAYMFGSWGPWIVQASSSRYRARGPVCTVLVVIGTGGVLAAAPFSTSSDGILIIDLLCPAGEAGVPLTQDLRWQLYRQKDPGFLPPSVCFP